jgi:hypothetical protein
MKTKNLLKVLFLIILVAAFSNNLRSQDCNSYYTLVNGNEYEMTHYNTKDKPDGKSINKITKVETAEGITIATVESKSIDKNNEESATATFSIKCEGMIMYVEMKSLASSNSGKQMEGIEMKTDASWMKLPQTLSIGMALDDATGTISMYKDGTLFSTIQITVTNRKVESRETITTSAGTFECYKITQDMQMTTSMMGMSLPPNQTKSVEYLSAGVGSVKTESYDKDGKLMGYSLLTKITKL